MPELPEVETVRRSLLPYLPGRRVERVEVRHSKVLLEPTPAEFCQRLGGLSFDRLERHGKLLIFRLPPLVLLIHLGMTGQLTFRDPSRSDRPFERHPQTGLERSLQHPVDRHTHITLEVGLGCAVHYRDVRKFGKWRLWPEERLPEVLSALGPDPLSSDWNLEAFAARTKSSQRAIKAILLDQSVLAGVGNIYADEALFVAGIRPDKWGSKLSAKALEKLFEAIPQVLQKGLYYGGTSLSDYVDADGQKGSHQEKLLAYGRYGLACNNCGETLQKATIAQRTTTWCRRCQR